MSTCYIQLKKPREALNCLIEALKYKRESLSMWENYVILSISLDDFSKAISGIEEIVKLPSSSLSPIIIKVGIIRSFKMLHIIVINVELTTRNVLIFKDFKRGHQFYSRLSLPN